MKSKFYGILTSSLLLLLSACGGRVPQTPSGASNQAVILSPSRNSAYIFDLLTNRIDYTIPTGSNPQDLALGQGGLVFVSNSQENSFSTFQRSDPWTWYSIGKVGTLDRPGRLAYSNTNQELYLTAADAPRLSVYRVNGKQRPLQQQVLRLDDGLGKPTALALSSDGQTLYVAGKELQSLSRANQKLSSGQTLALPENADISDMLLANNQLWLADRNGDQLLVVDLASFKQTGTIKLGEGLDSPVLPERMALNHAGSKIYLTGSGASVAQVLDVKNQKLLQTLKLAGDEVKNPAEAPAGVAVLGNDRQVYITARSGRNLAILDANPDVGQTDKIDRTIGTAVHEALLPPLGAIEIF